MPCLLALIVLSILGIFSSTHRKLAKEAFDCVFRRVTLRPCNTGFDTKVKAAILGKLINRSVTLAKFVSTYFEWLAWAFVIILTVSSVYTARSLYNFWAWGDCNGPNTGGFCAFDPTGTNNKVSSVGSGGNCVDAKLAIKNLSLKPLGLSGYPTIQSKTITSKQVVFIGCYNCDYTRKAWPMMKQLLQKVPANLTFIEFPSKPETTYLMPYDYCLYQEYPAQYWSYVDRMFDNTKDTNASESAIVSQLTAAGVMTPTMKQCLASSDTKKAVAKEYDEVQKTDLYGTPTVFINGVAVVGPKPERVYRRLLNQSLF